MIFLFLPTTLGRVALGPARSRPGQPSVLGRKRNIRFPWGLVLASANLGTKVSYRPVLLSLVRHRPTKDLGYLIFPFSFNGLGRVGLGPARPGRPRQILDVLMWREAPQKGF